MAKKSKPEAQDFSFFRPDENDLVGEWIRQPELMFEWSQKAADAKADVERAKAELDLVAAETANAIRTNPADYDLEKVTENAVKEAVPLQAEYKDAYEEWTSKRHHYDVTLAAVNALDHRKKALENLVRLFLAGYFGEPRLGRDGTDSEDVSEAMDELVKTRERRKSNLPRKKKRGD